MGFTDEMGGGFLGCPGRMVNRWAGGEQFDGRGFGEKIWESPKDEIPATIY
jgi:hypothetical protein